VSWTNTFLSFRIRPADENQWLQTVDEAMSHIVPPEHVASHPINRRDSSGEPERDGVSVVEVGEGQEWTWRERNVRAAVVLEALTHSPREWIHYSRRRANACVAFPAMSDEFNTRRIARVVDGLADQELVHSHRVPPGEDNDYCSSFMALPKLRSLLRVPALTERPDDSIWLRDEYGRRKMVRDTPEVRRMRRRRDAHNALMAGVRIGLAGYEHDGARYRIGPDYDVYTANVSGHRIFNESFEYGGRIYGPWPQGVPMRDEPIRRNLTLNGEPVVELDYQAHHLRILYAQAGAEMPVDPYTVPAFERSTGKTAMLVIINAKTERGAIQAVAEGAKLSRPDAKKLIAELKELNRPIATSFHSDAGRMLQRVDSDIMEDAVSSLVSEEIACVPVHDSLIVPATRRAMAYDAMAAAWSKQFPDTSTRIDAK
jgi:hypothetical protein